jgi:hypothetical protein
MKINGFESRIDPTILKRGFDYYQDEHVADTYERGDREYVFLVEGRGDDYEVIVKLDEAGEILHSHCDCPFGGAVCKHEVAAYYELAALFESEDWGNSEQQQVFRQPELAEVLSQLSKEELIGIIADLAQKDTILRNTLMVNYVKGDERHELEMCKKLVAAIVRKYRGRDGSISYRDTAQFAQEMSGMAEKARMAANGLSALKIAFLLLEEAILAFQDVGFLADETLELVEDIIRDSLDQDPGSSESLFDYLLERCEADFFDGWEDYRIELLRICAGIAGNEACRNRLTAVIKRLIDQKKEDAYSRYTTESLLSLLLEMTGKYGTEQEAEQMMKEHLQFSSFREQYIQKLMKERKFHEAVEAALEGEAHDKSLPGLVNQWKKLRYTAYKELLLRTEQEQLARELLQQGHFEYYNELKIHAAEDSGALYERLKPELKQDKSWQAQNMYLRLIKEEHDLDELLSYVKEHPSQIEEFADLLADRFKGEVAELYQDQIRSAASTSSNRKQYQAVCGMLLRFGKIAGGEPQQNLILELRSAYAYKPAFVDELSKLK